MATTAIVAIVRCVLFVDMNCVLPGDIILLGVVNFLVFFSRKTFGVAVVIVLGGAVRCSRIQFRRQRSDVVSTMESFTAGLTDTISRTVITLVLVVDGVCTVDRGVSKLRVGTNVKRLASRGMVMRTSGFVRATSTKREFVLHLKVMTIPMVSVKTTCVLVGQGCVVSRHGCRRLMTRVGDAGGG